MKPWDDATRDEQNAYWMGRDEPPTEEEIEARWEAYVDTADNPLVEIFGEFAAFRAALLADVKGGDDE